MLPIDMLGIGRIMQNNTESEERKIARVKRLVLEQLAIRTQGGATMLMEVGGEFFSYDPDVPWLISTLTTEVQAGEAVTSAVMRQPLGAGPLSCAAFLPYADDIVD